MDETDVEVLIEQAENKIALGRELFNSLETYSHVDGTKKVQRKIQQEIKFLEKVVKNKTVKSSNILCSNLTHFQTLVKALAKFEGLKHVDFALPVSVTDKSIKVDIVASSGATLCKVIARNSKSLRDNIEGKGSYGARSILDQAEELVEAAKVNPHLYKPPKVVFLFVNPVGREVEEALEEKGVEVQYLDESLPAPERQEVTVLNIDVTTLIAYTSNISNGGTKFDYEDRVLKEQRQMELKNPVKPILEELFRGKRLICCETAVTAFQNIVNLLAGPEETVRCEEFLTRLEVLPDVELPPELAHICVTSKLKERSLKIFSFGIFHRALNVTSNEGFYRSVKMQGVDIPVFLHEARALTEMKQKDPEL